MIIDLLCTNPLQGVQSSHSYVCTCGTERSNCSVTVCLVKLWSWEDLQVTTPRGSLALLSLGGLIAGDSHLNPTLRKAFAALFYMVRLCFGGYE